MSFVLDHVRRVDAQLDQLHFPKSQSGNSLSIFSSVSDPAPISQLSLRTFSLQNGIRTLSAASASHTLLSSGRIHTILSESLNKPSNPVQEASEVDSTLEAELEWLLVGKATAQIYGLILARLLEDTIPLRDDLWYWEDVLGSYRYLGLFSVQTSPQRLWAWVQDIYHGARQKLDSARPRQAADTVSDRWRRFYGLVKETARERSLAKVQARIVSPLMLCRAEARSKHGHLKRLRDMSACGLGILTDEGMSFEVDDHESTVSKAEPGEDDNEEWKSVISKSIALMEAILRHMTDLDLGANDFEDAVFVGVDQQSDPTLQHQATRHGPSSDPLQLAESLHQIIQIHLPKHSSTYLEHKRKYGKPSRLVRYWVPAVIVLLSSGTVFRYLVNRRAEITTWIRDAGATATDFWLNWVVEPVKKIIGTIRHDKDSEIAIMSKASLEGDRASLERMVIDFEQDTANATRGTALSAAELAQVTTKVREGDLTPVLKAYERDLRKPFVGTIKGDLIRALLIQIQKTKVDVEIAIGGIDALLKSQELVFGYAHRGVLPKVRRSAAKK